MNTAVNLNVVHESEAQRQHARVKLPAKIRFASNREVHDLQLVDLSAGGFSFASERPLTKVGDYHRGKLLFLIDNLSLGVEVEFQVRFVDQASGRVGCQFHNLKPREIATLRHLISSHLSGELITVGDLLSILQRENFTKPRKQAGGAGMGPLGRLRAVTVSAVVFLVGLGAFGFILNQVYEHHFVARAEAGQVAVPHMQVTMPREGTVQSLVPASGKVAKGAPVATFSATMLEMLKGSLTDEQLTAESIEAFFGRQLTGTMTSPCDCKVVRQLVADGQFASKGTPVFELAPLNSQATVEARFRYDNFNKVRPGAEVSMRVSGEDTVRRGTIVSSALQDGGLSSDIHVVIQPEGGMDTELAGRPVEVTIDSGPSVDWMADKAIAAGL